MEASPSAPLGALVDGLAGPGWACAPRFIPDAAVAALAVEASSLLGSGLFRPAAVAGKDKPVVVSDVRGDSILWWEPGRLTPAQEALWAALERLREELNRSLFLALRWTEAHYAFYPPGTGYSKHLDNRKGAERRVVSCVFYLNREWAPEDGGELALHLESGVLAVEPRAGTLACFLSKEIAHEVRPNARGRWSVTAWLGRG